MKKLKYLYPSLIAGFSAIPLLAGAQTSIPTILTNILAILNTVLLLLFAIATIVFIWGVIQFVASAGDETARTKAKGIMTWGIIGLAVMAAAWGLVKVLTTTFAIDTTARPTIPSF